MFVMDPTRLFLWSFKFPESFLAASVKNGNMALLGHSKADDKMIVPQKEC